MTCKCYHAERNFLGKIGVCWGTKECEACLCGGDESKCDFYEDKRKAEEYIHLVIPKKLYEADTTPGFKGVTEWKVTGALYHDGAVESYEVQTKNMRAVMFSSEIGKTVFPTREEAEAVLAASKGGYDAGTA